MAAPRIVRFLGLLCIPLFIFVVLSMMWKPSGLPLAGEKLPEMTRDPNLDRASSWRLFFTLCLAWPPPLTGMRQ